MHVLYQCKNPVNGLVTAQLRMGNKRIDKTARYTKPSEKEIEGAVERLELDEK